MTVVVRRRCCFHLYHPASPAISIHGVYDDDPDSILKLLARPNHLPSETHFDHNSNLGILGSVILGLDNDPDSYWPHLYSYFAPLSPTLSQEFRNLGILGSDMRFGTGRHNTHRLSPRHDEREKRRAEESLVSQDDSKRRREDEFRDRKWDERDGLSSSVAASNRRIYRLIP